MNTTDSGTPSSSASQHLTFEQGSQMVADFYARHPHPNSPQLTLNSLGSELGELLKEYDKSTGYGTRAFETTPGFRGEYGDLLATLLLLGTETGLSPADELHATLNKYEERMLDHGHMGSGR